MAALRSFRVAAFGALLVAVGMALDACFWWWRFALEPRAHLIAIAVAVGLFALLYARRRHPLEWLGTAAFSASNAAALTALWATDSRLVHMSHWNPFDAQKLGALTVALLTPPRAWVGILNIAAYTVVPIAEFLSWGPAVRADVTPAAPFSGLMYGLFACGILALQLRRIGAEQRHAQQQAHAAALERFARMLLSVRNHPRTHLSRRSN